MDFIAILTQAFGSIMYMFLALTSSGSFPRRLTEEEERTLLEAMAQGDTSARAKLIEHNLRLVAYINKKYFAAPTDTDDLISIGTIGLIKAIDTYSPDKGIKLSSYASRCIENEILMHLRSCKKSAQDISISEPIETDRQGNALTLMDVIAQEDTIAEDLAVRLECQAVRRCVAQLEDERCRQIITLRYGLDGRKPLTQKEIAALLGISRSYVSRIEKRALEQLRTMLK